MMDEVYLERKELARLLSTAKDEERREMVKKAMQALDDHENTISESSSSSGKFNVHALNPSIHASVYLSNNLPAVEGMNPTKMRPASARRRPSVPNLLDSIPEIITNPNKFGVNGKNHEDDEIILPYEDIAEVIPSSYDARFPVKSIFKANPNQYVGGGGSISGGVGGGGSSSGSGGGSNTSSSTNAASGGGNGGSPMNWNGISSSHLPVLIHSNSERSIGSMNSGTGGGGGGALNSSSGFKNRSYWMSTGLVPQFVVITFYEKWAIRKIEVKTVAVHRIAAHINYSVASNFSSAKLQEMKKEPHENNKFSLVVMNKDRQGVSGIGVTLVILESSDCFCGISQVKIMVTPNS